MDKDLAGNPVGVATTLTSDEDEKYHECLLLERTVDSQTAVTSTNRQTLVHVNVYEPAYLHCAISSTNGNMVAWTRLRDEAVLTVGRQRFTTDSRFQLSLKEDNSDWILIIRRAEVSDSGCYLCEVNTEPRSTIFSVYLNVFETPSSKAPTAPARQTANLMANMVGNEVLLNCTIMIDNETNTNGDQVEWWRDGRPIDFWNTSKYISKVKRNSGTIVHTLRILDASSEDDGNYACKLVGKTETTHTLHVNYNSNASVSDYALLRISLMATVVAVALSLLSRSS